MSNNAVTSSLIVINHKAVSITVTEIWPVENFQGQFDVDLVSQGHHKYAKWCTMTSSLSDINYKSVFLMVADWLGHLNI